MSYESELMLLKLVHLENRSQIIKKYKDVTYQHGLDGYPGEKELGDETKRFQREWNDLKKKYNK